MPVPIPTYASLKTVIGDWPRTKGVLEFVAGTIDDDNGQLALSHFKYKHVDCGFCGACRCAKV